MNDSNALHSVANLFELAVLLARFVLFLVVSSRKWRRGVEEQPDLREDIRRIEKEIKALRNEVKFAISSRRSEEKRRRPWWRFWRS